MHSIIAKGALTLKLASIILTRNLTKKAFNKYGCTTSNEHQFLKKIQNKTGASQVSASLRLPQKAQSFRNMPKSCFYENSETSYSAETHPLGLKGLFLTSKYQTILKRDLSLKF